MTTPLSDPDTADRTGCAHAPAAGTDTAAALLRAPRRDLPDGTPGTGPEATGPYATDRWGSRPDGVPLAVVHATRTEHVQAATEHARAATGSPGTRGATDWRRSCHGNTVEVRRFRRSEVVMVALGIILLVIGFLTGLSILWAIGIILLVIGAILWVLGALGHAVGGRRHYW